MKSGLGQRLKEVRGTRTQRDWAAELSLSLTMVGEYEKEMRVPRFDTVAFMAEKTGYSLDWIATGLGDKFGGIDQSVLTTAMTAADRIVESQAKQGKSYTREQVVAFVVDIYSSMIKEILAGKQSSVQVGPSTTGDDDDADRKESA